MHSRKRFAALGAVHATAVLVPLVVTQVVAQDGSTTRRRPPPTVEQTLAELPHIREAVERGEDVNIVLPDPPNPDARPFRHGPYRIVPSGFVGNLERQRLPNAPTDRGPRTVEPAAIHASPLWAQPAYLPGNATLSEPVRYYTEGLNAYVGAWYRIPGGEMLIGRQRQFEEPIDVGLALDPDGPLAWEFFQLDDGRFGIALYSKSAGSAGLDSRTPGYRYVRIHNPGESIETIIEVGTGGSVDYTPRELVRIAQSVGTAQQR
jgi:hypothetical protein